MSWPGRGAERPSKRAVSIGRSGFGLPKKTLFFVRPWRPHVYPGFAFLVIFYFWPFLGAFWGLFIIFLGFLKQIQVIICFFCSE